MRFLHLADLHLGKRVNEFSMIDDQKFVLKQILEIIKEYDVDAVLMAGDIYDKAVPGADAVMLLNEFLTKIAEMKVPAFVISGNHDSPERIGFGADIMSIAGIHMAKPYSGQVECVTMEDNQGKVNIYMLPFIKPAIVKHFKKDKEIDSYDDAVKVALEDIKLNKNQRNIIIAHQFIRGASQCESENVSVGGVEQVLSQHFKKFDYVALGHLHGPQYVDREYIRYSGTMLKYSFSEMDHDKSALLVDITLDSKDNTAHKNKEHNPLVINEKSNKLVSITNIPLKPLHDMREIKGTYDQVTSKSFYENMDVNDYLRVILTDEEDKQNAMELLRTIYPNIMKLEYDNTRTRQTKDIMLTESGEMKSPKELFQEFYEMQNNAPMTDEQCQIIQDMIEKIWN